MVANESADLQYDTCDEMRRKASANLTETGVT